MKQFSFSRRIEGTRSPRVRCCRLSVVVTSRLFQSYLGLPFVVIRMGQMERGRKREASKVDIYIWCRASTNLSVCLYIVKERERVKKREKREAFWLFQGRVSMDWLPECRASSYFFSDLYSAPLRTTFSLSKRKKEKGGENEERTIFSLLLLHLLFFFLLQG